MASFKNIFLYLLDMIKFDRLYYISDMNEASFCRLWEFDHLSLFPIYVKTKAKVFSMELS